MESPFKKIVVYDLETGGLKSSINAITEIALVCIDLEKLEIIDEASWLFKPYSEVLTYEEEALEVTHLSVERLEKEGLEKEVVLGNIIDFFEKHTQGNSKPILAGHNIEKFDNPFIEKFFTEQKKDFSKYHNKDLMIDTLKWARLKWFESPGYSLGICNNQVGITLKEAHRALPDTQANAKFLMKMLKSLRDEGAQTSKYKRRKFDFNF